jgi:hypothetical protein
LHHDDMVLHIVSEVILEWCNSNIPGGSHASLNQADKATSRLNS